MKKIKIAVDGPAGAGKGTVSKALAEKFNLAYMDTGTVFRATAYIMLKDNVSFDNEAVALSYAEKLGKEVSFDILKEPNLRTEEAGLGASKIATMPSVRKALLGCQVDFANNPPENKDGAILDGRDIGTVVCPEADIKLYITASSEVRAKRRYQQLIEKGDEANLAQILADVKARDKNDMERDSAPLKPAYDAIIIDTSEMPIEKVVAKASEIIESKLK